MVIVRGGGEDVSTPKQHFDFFGEMQTSITNIFNVIGTVLDVVHRENKNYIH